MASAALVDSGAMVAAFSIHQLQRAHYLSLFETAAAETWSLTTTWPCIVEASYLLGAPERYAMLRWVASACVSVFPIATATLLPLAQMMERWTERPRTEMDLADASLVWLASETGVTRIMTTDHRDFSRYRLPDGRAFEIL